MCAAIRTLRCTAICCVRWVPGRRSCVGKRARVEPRNRPAPAKHPSPEGLDHVQAPVYSMPRNGDAHLGALTYGYPRVRGHLPRPRRGTPGGGQHVWRAPTNLETSGRGQRLASERRRGDAECASALAATRSSEPSPFSAPPEVRFFVEDSATSVCAGAAAVREVVEDGDFTKLFCLDVTTSPGQLVAIGVGPSFEGHFSGA